MAADHIEPSAPVELDEAAHTLLCGLRAIAVGRAECPALRRMFAELCGASGDEALNVLFVFMKQLAFKGRRRLRLHAPGCCAISRDELTFLSAIAAAQGGPGEDGGDLLWLSSLTGGAADPALAHSLRCLAALLSTSGSRITLGEAPSWAEAPPARSQSVH